MEDDTPELALIGEPQIGVVLEQNREMLKTKRLSLAGRDFEMSGHPQVDLDARAVIEVDEQILPEASNRHDLAVDERRFNERGRERSEYSGERADLPLHDCSTNQKRFQ